MAPGFEAHVFEVLGDQRSMADMLKLILLWRWWIRGASLQVLKLMLLCCVVVVVVVEAHVVVSLR